MFGCKTFDEQGLRLANKFLNVFKQQIVFGKRRQKFRNYLGGTVSLWLSLGQKLLDHEIPKRDSVLPRNEQSTVGF
jgi:hypothetical protein